MQDYKLIKLYEKARPKNEKEISLKLFRKDKNMITIPEAKDIFDKLRSKYPDAKYMIRGRGPIGILTMKSYDADEIYDHEQEYFMTGGADEEHFYLEITIRK